MGDRSVVPGRGARMQLGMGKLTGFGLGCKGLGVMGPGWCSCMGCRGALSCMARGLWVLPSRVGRHVALEQSFEVI